MKYLSSNGNKWFVAISEILKKSLAESLLKFQSQPSLLSGTWLTIQNDSCGSSPLWSVTTSSFSFTLFLCLTVENISFLSFYAEGIFYAEGSILQGLFPLLYSFKSSLVWKLDWKLKQSRCFRTCCSLKRLSFHFSPFSLAATDCKYRVKHLSLFKVLPHFQTVSALEDLFVLVFQLGSLL